MSEHSHQVALCTWARLPSVQAQYPGIELLHCSLNGVKLSKAQAGKAKAAGMLKGVPDLMLPVRRGPYVSLAIEMKYGRNKTTEEQDWFLERLRQEGWKVEVCYSWDAARDIIVSYLQEKDLFADQGHCRVCSGSMIEPDGAKA